MYLYNSATTTIMAPSCSKIKPEAREDTKSAEGNFVEVEYSSHSNLNKNKTQ